MTRRLTYAFYRLPHCTRLQIALDLNLVGDDDAGLSDEALFRLVFERARAQGLLPQLNKRISAYAK